MSSCLGEQVHKSLKCTIVFWGSMNSVSCWLFVDQRGKHSHRSDGGGHLVFEDSNTSCQPSSRPQGPHLTCCHLTSSFNVYLSETNLSVPTGCQNTPQTVGNPPLPSPPLFSLDWRIPVCQQCQIPITLAPNFFSKLPSFQAALGPRMGGIFWI